MKLKKLSSSGIAHYMIPLMAVLLVGVIGTGLLIHSDAATCTSYVYKNGSSGTCVKYIQNILNEYNFFSNQSQLTVDGLFGPRTETSVRNLQYLNGEVGSYAFKTITMDGIVGPNTWHKVCEFAAAANQWPNGFPTTAWPQLVRTGNASAKSAGCSQWYTYP